MNAVEIKDAVSGLAQNTFDRSEFLYELIKAFGNKDVTSNCSRSRFSGLGRWGAVGFDIFGCAGAANMSHRLGDPAL